MSLSLHGHHVLIIATLAFAAAVLTPNWYMRSSTGIQLNIFQICEIFSPAKNCEWTFTAQSNAKLSQYMTLLYPILTASFAIVCAGLSLIALVLGSCYIHQYASGNGSIWLLVCTMLTTLLCFLFSCAVWGLMLTTNLQQKSFGSNDINLTDFGFSFWINIGSSAAYLYAVLIYLIAVCKS